MGVLVVIFALGLATAVVLLISGPVRSAQHRESALAASDRPPPERPKLGAVERRAELEAAREAKYKEIRDAELDYRTGKLSPTDYQAIDSQLRAEALTILDELEGLTEPESGAEGGSVGS